MGDYYYAVQIRNMQTAIHHAVIFSVESVAEDFYNFVDNHERYPDNDEIDYSSLIDDIEIDYRVQNHIISGNVPVLFINNTEYLLSKFLTFIEIKMVNT